MANLSIPDDLKEQAAARAAANGYADVEAFVAALLRAEAVGAPNGLSVDSDNDLQSMIADRLDGPWVDVDAADFARIRAKFEASHDGHEGRRP